MSFLLDVNKYRNIPTETTIWYTHSWGYLYYTNTILEGEV